MPIDVTATVREIVKKSPRAARVFESFGINHWSSGHRSLEEVCAIGNLSIVVLQDQLADALGQPHRVIGNRWMSCALGDLINYIVERHAYAKSELFRLRNLVEKICSRHHLSHPELYRVRESIQLLSDELLPHMRSEEQELFTHLKAMETALGKDKRMPAVSGSIVSSVRPFVADHGDIGQVLKRLRIHTKEYAIPEAACISFEALYSGLDCLEMEIRQGIYLENDILFPRALELQKYVKQSALRGSN